MPRDTYKVQENELLQRAIHAFHEATDLTIEVKKQHVRTREGYEIDAILKLNVPGKIEELAAEIKRPLTTATLPAAVQQLKRFPWRGLIVTDYVNPRMADRLREMNIPFIDTAGNAYLNIPPLFIFIKGNRMLEEPLKEPVMRAFQPAGLKVIFTFLCDQRLVTAPFREIANAAHVALGTVHWVITDLKALGHLIETRGGRRLTNLDQLLTRWVAAYPERLRPGLVIGKFTAPDPHWWKRAVLRDAYWGGEVAAAKATGYLKPEIITIYVRDRVAEFPLKNRLRKDPGGRIELLRAFWDVRFDEKDQGLVPPLLTYADLLATGDPRNIETAELIRERRLAELIA